jgi:hypothetical protein
MLVNWDMNKSLPRIHRCDDPAVESPEMSVYAFRPSTNSARGHAQAKVSLSPLDLLQGRNTGSRSKISTMRPGPLVAQILDNPRLIWSLSHPVGRIGLPRKQ